MSTARGTAKRLKCAHCKRPASTVSLREEPGYPLCGLHGNAFEQWHHGESEEDFEAFAAKRVRASP